MATTTQTQVSIGQNPRPALKPFQKDQVGATSSLQTQLSGTTCGSSIATQPSKPVYIEPRTEFFLDWIFKVLGVVAAILFGIWAPISYKATADGNADNNASQESLVSRLDRMGTQASSAASLQASALFAAQGAASGIAKLRSQMDDLATLRVWEFCDGRADEISACAELSAKVAIDTVITSLVSDLSPPFVTKSSVVPSRTGSMSTLSARTNSAQAPSNSSGDTTAPKKGAPGGVSASVSLAVVLGGVFGSLAVVGLASGLLVWRQRLRRVKERFEVKG